MNMTVDEVALRSSLKLIPENSLDKGAISFRILQYLRRGKDLWFVLKVLSKIKRNLISSKSLKNGYTKFDFAKDARVF